jgi:hypothetical protein
VPVRPSRSIVTVSTVPTFEATRPSIHRDGFAADFARMRSPARNGVVAVVLNTFVPVPIASDVVDVPL